jgi:tRNA pseudouridine55 synthase
VVPDGDLELPVGTVTQRPPAYSAIKVSGQRAYKLARAGQAVDLPERKVVVYRFEEVSRERERRRFVIECSAGTYVRTLIADLGDAYCEELRRTRIGPFDVAEADPAVVIPLDQALSFLPEIGLDAELARRARHGVRIPATAPPRGVVRLIDEDGLVALAEGDLDTGELRPLVVLRPA